MFGDLVALLSLPRVSRSPTTEIFRRSGSHFRCGIETTPLRLDAVEDVGLGEFDRDRFEQELRGRPLLPPSWQMLSSSR